jgi:hypothetical protein
MAAAGDGLEVTSGNIPIGRDDTDVVGDAAHMEVLGGLLFVE